MRPVHIIPSISQSSVYFSQKDPTSLIIRAMDSSLWMFENQAASDVLSEAIHHLPSCQRDISPQPLGLRNKHRWFYLLVHTYYYCLENGSERAVSPQRQSWGKSCEWARLRVFIPVHFLLLHNTIWTIRFIYYCSRPCRASAGQSASWGKKDTKWRPFYCKQRVTALREIQGLPMKMLAPLLTPQLCQSLTWNNHATSEVRTRHLYA